jgi:hypothetical protein
MRFMGWWLPTGAENKSNESLGCPCVRGNAGTRCATMLTKRSGKASLAERREAADTGASDLGY